MACRHKTCFRKRKTEKRGYNILTQAKCTNCGAALNVDPEKEAAICPYCNSTYIVEKAINNYHISTVKAENVYVFNDDTVNVEQLYKNADALLAAQQYDRACAAYSDISLTRFNEARCHEGFLKAATHQFQLGNHNKINFDEIVLEANALKSISPSSKILKEAEACLGSVLVERPVKAGKLEHEIATEVIHRINKMKSVFPYSTFVKEAENYLESDRNMKNTRDKVVIILGLSIFAFLVTVMVLTVILRGFIK